MRIVFMGTPDFASCSLEKLYSEKYDVVAVFSQPDKPKGRGMELQPTDVKKVALAHNALIFQPTSLKNDEIYETIKELKPDILVVVAYGKLIPDRILALPKYGAINVHGSLLPKYRGASPIQAAVLNGDDVTGVTTMYLASEMDTGDIIYSSETEIGDFETSGELFDRLMVMGADLLVKTLRDIEAGVAPRIKQDHTKASYVSQLDKSICPIDWSKSPKEIVKHIYGLQPWPIATMNLGESVVKVFSAEYTDTIHNKEPGKILYAGKNGIEVSCGNNKSIMITEIQAPGKKRVKAKDYLLGHPISVQE